MPTILFVSKLISANTSLLMQTSLRVLHNFHLNYEVILEPFRVWAIYVFTFAAGFFLLLDGHNLLVLRHPQRRLAP